MWSFNNVIFDAKKAKFLLSKSSMTFTEKKIKIGGRMVRWLFGVLIETAESIAKLYFISQS